jgi:hypothetical protein
MNTFHLGVFILTCFTNMYIIYTANEHLHGNDTDNPPRHWVLTLSKSLINLIHKIYNKLNWSQ